MEHLDESTVRQLWADPAGAAREARDKCAAARVWLMKHKPFFGVLARALRLEPTLEIAGFRLLPDDRVRMNPVVVLAAGFPALVARLAHLSLHAALGAFARRGQRDPRRWNVAHDLAIQPLLEAAELSVGELFATGAGAALPARASAEIYYDLLDDGATPDALWCDLCEPVPERDAPPAGTFTREEGGEGADERARQLEWNMRLNAALEEETRSGGRTFGEMPAWLEEMVRATLEPPADWSVALQEHVSALTRGARTYLRPSRRMSALAGSDGAWPDTVTMPGRRVKLAGRLVAVVDTSGSIATSVLSHFLGTIASVATGEGIDEVRLVQADAAVLRDETLNASELLFYEVAMVGRGGTDFGPALLALAAEAARLGQRFSVAYLTDLDGAFPSAADVAPLDVLWVVPGGMPARPPFGRMVRMAPR